MNYIKIIITVVFLLLIGTNIYLYKQIKRETLLKNEAQTSLKIAYQDVQFYQNKKGKTVSEVATNNVSLETFKAMFANQITDLHKQIGNLKNLQSLINTQILTQGKFTTLITDSVVYDSIKIKTFAYSDGFLNLQCACSDSAACQYSYTDSVSVLVRFVKPPNWRWYNPISWFYKKESSTEVSFKNPSSRAVFIQSVFIKK